MRTAKPPSGRRVSDWIGLNVRTVRELRNGWAGIAAGTMCRVLHARGGLSMETAPCKCCGVKVFISRIDPADVEVV